MIDWKELSSSEELLQLKEESFKEPVIVFKHSTRCSISNMVLDRLNRNWEADNINPQPYYLDLLAYRSLSNQIELEYNVQHESPQVIILSQGKAVYHASHQSIDYTQIKSTIRAIAKELKN